MKPILATLVLSLVSDFFAVEAQLHQSPPPSFLSDKQHGFSSSNKAQQVLEHRPKTELSQCNLTGPIEATQCDYETLESVNGGLHENLHELVRMPFFKYLKIDLNRECPYWDANGYCVLKDCAVTTVDESDIPQAWRTACLSRLKRPPKDELRKSLPGCYYRESDYCVLDDDESGDGEYVDLVLNPERFTGYSGPAAHKIWQAIYDENCFGLSEPDFHQSLVKADNPGSSLLTTSPFGVDPLHLSPLVNEMHESEKETCLEKRVFYRIVSGLHASISTHLCHKNFDQKLGVWGPNLQCFIDRVASNPERLQYIYFNAVLLLRAMSRAGPYLSAYDVYSGIGSDPSEGRRTSQLLTQVLSIAKNVGQFDEKSLFRGEDAETLKEEFKVHFRNITRIMDCVGCDKCRLWGKVQTSGLGTALKILFELDEKALDPTINPDLLQRSEVVTLVNTIHQLSESLQAVEEFRYMWAEREGGLQSLPHGMEAPPKVPHADFASSASPGCSEEPGSQGSHSNIVADAFEACRRNAEACITTGVQIAQRAAHTIATALHLTAPDTSKKQHVEL